MRGLSRASLRIGDEGRNFYRPLFRVHQWVRLGFYAHLVLLLATRWEQVRLPLLAVAVALMAGAWTIFTSQRYTNFIAHLGGMLLADVVVTTIVVVMTPVVGLRPMDSGTSLAGLWIAGAPMAVAIRYGSLLGGTAGLVVAAAAYALNPSLAPDVWSSAIVLVVAAAGLGWLIEQFRGSTRERQAYFATAAALGERERLNRIVHDGVLQVLAMVEREGKSFGQRGEQLARAAHEQEVSLRALLQDKNVDVTVGEVVAADKTSLTSLLDRHESDRVSIATLADDVLLPTWAAQELDGVVVEVLSNVWKHAGPDARAWVLLEQEGNELILSIRDDGVGAAMSEINNAGLRGRFGVQNSIYGRIRDLGGVATVRAARGRGVEWEFRIPAQ